MNQRPPAPRRTSRVLATSLLATALGATVLGGTVPAASAASAASTSASSSTSASAATGTPAHAARAASPAGAVVTVGGVSHAVAATNRSAGSGVVVYTAPRKATPKLRSGFAVVAKHGKVVRKVEPRAGRKAPRVRVPRQGFVVTATGSTASWLRSVSKVGKPVKVNRSAAAPTAPARTTVPTTLVAGANVTVAGASRRLTGVNVARGIDALVAYRSPVTRTTTNMWGIELVVVGGRVVSVNDRQLSRSAVGTAVPSGGWVLSAHGSTADWLRSVATRGAAVAVTPVSAVTTPDRPVATPTPTPTPTPVPTPAPTPAPAPDAQAPMGLPAKVQSIYHMMWSNSGSPQLRNIPANVNVVNLAFLQHDRTTNKPGIVGWGSQSQASFVADAAALRARGVRIVASVGGMDGNVDVSNREAFVQGVMDLNAKLPLDGLDWDIEGDVPMAPADIVWISKRLKQLRGQDFAITMAPNGSNIDHYRAIAVQLHQQDALDMIGQQFYDAVVTKEAAKWRVGQLVTAGIPQSKIAVGMMVGNADIYWTVDECLTAVQFIKQAYPGIRGGYLWEAGRAGTADWASRLNALLMR